jgi:hypothetical protein
MSPYFLDTFDFADGNWPSSGDLGSWDSAVSPTNMLHRGAGRHGYGLSIGPNPSGNSNITKNLDFSWAGFNYGAKIGFWINPSLTLQATSKKAPLIYLTDMTNGGMNQFYAYFTGSTSTGLKLQVYFAGATGGGAPMPINFQPYYTWNLGNYPINAWYWVSFRVGWGGAGDGGRQHVLLKIYDSNHTVLAGLPWTDSATNGDGNNIPTWTGDDTPYGMNTENAMAVTSLTLGCRIQTASGMTGTILQDILAVYDVTMASAQGLLDGDGFLIPLEFNMTIPLGPPAGSRSLLGVGT